MGIYPGLITPESHFAHIAFRISSTNYGIVTAQSNFLSQESAANVTSLFNSWAKYYAFDLTTASPIMVSPITTLDRRAWRQCR